MHSAKVGFVQATGIPTVAIINFVFCLVSGYTDFFGIYDNDKIPSVNMRRINRLMLASQTLGNCDGKAPQHLIGRIYQ